MPFVMTCWSVFDKRLEDCVGKHLQWYDPNKEKEPLGGWTEHLSHAMKFASHVEAMTCWNQVRTVNGGVRADGLPDKPLTAFSVEIAPCDE